MVMVRVRRRVDHGVLRLLRSQYHLQRPTSRQYPMFVVSPISVSFFMYATKKVFRSPSSIWFPCFGIYGRELSIGPTFTASHSVVLHVCDEECRRIATVTRQGGKEAEMRKRDIPASFTSPAYVFCGGFYHVGCYINRWNGWSCCV